jgi:phenylalanyl-tRNA synthetase alpha chain
MNTIDISLLINELMDTLEKASNATQVTEYKNIFVKNNLTPLYDQLKTLPGNEKGALGKIINEFKEAIQVVYDEYLKIIKINEDAKQHVVDYDITVNSTKLQKGAVNPLSLVFREILSYFQSLNFTIQSGEEVMDPKYNFDNLNIPETHPTRETSETFYTKTQSLRTQLTASSAQFIENNQDKEIRIANFGYVYRNDELDATHSPQFNQVDFIWVKEGLNVKNLK